LIRFAESRRRGTAKWKEKTNVSLPSYVASSIAWGPLM